MKKNDIVSYFKKGKLVQLLIMIAVTLCFFVVLVTNTTIKENLYSNSSLFTLCAFVWGVLILGFISIFFDFYKLNRYASVEDTLEMKRFMAESNGMLNRFSCDSVFNSDEVQQVLAQVGCSMIEISNLREINEKFGRDAGDVAIQDFCGLLESIGNDYGIVVRNGGNEFLIVVADCTTDLMNQCLEELGNSIALYNEAEGACPIEIRSTYVLNSEQNFDRFSEILTLAYKQLHS